MIRTKALYYTYPKGATMVFPDLDCAAGSQWLLLGPSGCGKTTLLHLLGGLLQPMSGNVVLNDTHLEQLSTAALDSFRGKNVGIVFQKPHFLQALTVGENLLLAQSLSGKGKDETAAKDLLEKLGIAHHWKHLPQHLSAGEQQRLSIARALIHEPSLLLADEPTSALDDHHTEQVLQLLRDLSKDKGATLLIVTHDSRLKNQFPNQVVHLQAIV